MYYLTKILFYISWPISWRIYKNKHEHIPTTHEIRLNTLRIKNAISLQSRNQWKYLFPHRIQTLIECKRFCTKVHNENRSFSMLPLCMYYLLTLTYVFCLFVNAFWLLVFVFIIECCGFVSFYCIRYNSWSIARCQSQREWVSR